MKRIILALTLVVSITLVTAPVVLAADVLDVADTNVPSRNTSLSASITGDSITPGGNVQANFNVTPYINDAPNGNFFPSVSMAIYGNSILYTVLGLLGFGSY